MLQINWNKWIILNGACFVVLNHYGLTTPLTYLFLSTIACGIMCVVRERLNERQKKIEAVQASIKTIQASFTEFSRREACEVLRSELSNRYSNASTELTRVGLLGYGGASAEVAMAGLSNIKQTGLSAQQFVSPMTEKALASSRSFYDLMRFGQD